MQEPEGRSEHAAGRGSIRSEEDGGDKMALMTRRPTAVMAMRHHFHRGF